jgi:hypothetical protein
MVVDMVYGNALEWKHCPDGFELVDLGPAIEPAVRSFVERTAIDIDKQLDEVGGKVFRPKTPRRYPIRLKVDDLENPVVLHFVNAHDDEARASFLGAFGFLYGQTYDLHPRDEVVTYQRHMRKLLASAGSDEPNEAAINKFLRGDLVPVLAGRRLSFALHSLVGVMLREIVMVAEKDARFTTCQHCKKAFLTGPTTGRRSHAAYCSDRCRVAAMRARNSGH